MNHESRIKNLKKCKGFAFIPYSIFHIRHFSTRGFTLIEMIVSLALFSIVAVVALGALTNIVSANKKAQTLHGAITNLSFALETISRELRVGSGYHCDPDGGAVINPELYTGQSCFEGGGEMIVFKSSKQFPDGAGGTCQALVAYNFREDFDTAPGTYFLERAEQTECGDTLEGYEFSPIISSANITITSYAMSVSSGTYPLAYLRIGGYAGVRDRERTYFNVQTAVSPRVNLP